MSLKVHFFALIFKFNSIKLWWSERQPRCELLLGY